MRALASAVVIAASAIVPLCFIVRACMSAERKAVIPMALNALAAPATYVGGLFILAGLA